METKATLCVPVLDVLDKDNYLDWSVRVKTYLMAQDLWDIIDQELTNENPKHGDDEATFRKWSKKNFMVLHVIQNSCGPDTFYHIRNITSAKSAWDTLAQKYEVLPDQNTSSVGLEKNNYEGWSARVKANLMAQDVWDIVEATTEAPKEEDAFKAAWSKKNSLALNVIQNSCGLDTFYQIRKITSAKSAWNTLEKKYKVPGTTSSVGRDVVLDKDNYEGWSASLKANLMAQDHLWVDIFEATSEAPKEEDEDAFKEWSKKNSLALTVIQNSCGPDAKSKIKEISLAKDAWDALAIEYKEPKLGLILHDALKIGRWKNVKTILDKHRKEFPALLRAKITSGGETALHIAVTFGYDQIVKELVAQMTEEDLLITDDDSYTALMSAVVRGRDVQVRCMLGKNRKLSDIKTDDGILPVYMAMYSGQVKIAKYLFYNTPPQAVLNIRKPPSDQKDMKNGAKLCVLAVASEHFDIALSLIQDYCNCLAFADNGEGRTPLLELASKPHAFPSGNRFVFWKQWIYKCIGGQAVPVPPVPTTKAMASNETLVSIPNEDHRGEHDQVDRSIGSAPTSLYHVLFSKVWNFVDGTVLGIRQLYETKRIHQQSEELLGHICSRIPYLNNEERKVGSINEAIMSAVKNGITEIVVEMLQADLELQWERDEMCRNIFWVAILHRQSKIFKIIFMLDLKKALMNIKDNDKNCILHMAGMVGDSTVLDRIPGAALQMQRELQWFKELESIVPRTLTEATNNDDLTPWQLFKKNHMNLKKEGERWMKDTSTSCTVVGALIITIMFAAAITFPGGIDQNTGLPFLLNDELFILFIISDAFSLFSATTSVLMFLGILTSRYAEVDFLVSLPRKMVIGLSTLCFSIAAMMTSFSAILLIMLRGHPLYRQTWIISVAICLASIPVTLFVLMQFPLLVVMFISTYCRRIVDRKLKHCFN